MHKTHALPETNLGAELLLTHLVVWSDPSQVYPAGHALQALEAMCLVLAHARQAGYDPVPLPCTQLPPP